MLNKARRWPKTNSWLIEEEKWPTTLVIGVQRKAISERDIYAKHYCIDNTNNHDKKKQTNNTNIQLKAEKEQQTKNSKKKIRNS